MKKTIGIIFSVICLLITATSVLGIITANQGKVETIDPDMLRELYTISDMPFPDPPADGETDIGDHPRSDTFVQLVKKKTDNTLTGRLRVLEGMTKKYESLEADLVKNEGMKQGSEEISQEIEKRFVEDITSYGLYSDVTHLSTWEKFCLFAITWRSVMLIFGFLGLGLGLAIVSSSTVKSDLDGQ